MGVMGGGIRARKQAIADSPEGAYHCQLYLVWTRGPGRGDREDVLAHVGMTPEGATLKARQLEDIHALDSSRGVPIVELWTVTFAEAQVIASSVGAPRKTIFPWL